MRNRVLVIAAHADDEVLGCGATVARHGDEGDVVHLVVVTRGAPDLYPQEELDRTRWELESARAVLGIGTVHLLDFLAPRLDTVPGHAVADAIRGVLGEVRPTIIYVPHRGDLHSDHKAAYWATLVAARPNSGEPVPRILCYETLSETEWGASTGYDAFVPTVFVDVSKYLPKKLEALGSYASKLRGFPHPRSMEAVEALARLRGATVGVDAAEAFMLIREIVR